ncbi:xylulokinase [Gammaproteobacteria bacterium]|nr:xylulokinase [Gammaproteobacteria bacterium]
MLLGIDIGTSSLKTAIYSRKGQLQWLEKIRYQPDFPQNGWAQIDPLIWYHALISALSNCPRSLKQKISALSFSGQMHGVVATDIHSNPLYPAILWLDQRADGFIEEILQDQVDITLCNNGNQIYNGAMAGSILWLRAQCPDIFKCTAKFLSPKDWLRTYLTQKSLADLWVSEPSDSSGTLLSNLSGNWDLALFHYLKLDLKQFPKIVASTTITGLLAADIAKVLGLPLGVKIIAGGSDTGCAAIGAGFLSNHHTMLTTGTGAQLITRYTTVPHPKKGLHIFSIPTSYERNQPNHLWYQMAAMLNCGSVLEWMRCQFAIEWDQIYTEAFSKNTIHDSLDLIAHPWLNGERSPWMNPKLSAGWVGIKAHHTRKDLIYAMLRSVALSIKIGFEYFDHHSQVAHLLFAGGGSTHPLWRQMIANALNKPLHCLDEVDLSAKGAAMLAGLGTNLLTLADLHYFAPITVCIVKPEPIATDDFERHKVNLLESISSL